MAYFRERILTGRFISIFHSGSPALSRARKTNFQASRVECCILVHSWRVSELAQRRRTSAAVTALGSNKCGARL